MDHNNNGHVPSLLHKLMGAADLAFVVAAAPMNREDCKRTKHDSHFSKWQVLVGPSDWEDHSLGKEGAARYRVHNLPNATSPGLYELGIAVSPTAKIDSDGVVVVYLGQADNVRTRLQCYGRSGAHLNNPNEYGLKSEPGLFEDIFGRGYYIVYRWVPMKSKADALKEEARLLDRFDYAWNKGSNGARRHHDVLSKLNKISSRNVRSPKFVRKILHASQMPVGIKIKGTKLLSLEQKFNNYADDKSNNFFPQFFKFSRSQPKLVLDRQDVEDGQGTSQPVKGTVRCEEHKGLKVHGNFSRSDEKNSTPVYGEDSKSSTFDGREYGSSTCGAKMPSGSYCTRPVKGNTSCWQHSAQISHRDSTTSSCSDWKYGVTSLCGAPTQNGSRCRRQVMGGGRCWQHPVHAQVDGGPGVLPSPFVSDRNSSNSSRNDSTTSSCSDWKYGVTSLCGAPTQNGSRCRRQVNGGGRCWQHPVHTQVDGGLGLLPSLYASDRSSSNSSRNDWKYEGTSLCGARTRNNSSCRRHVKGGGRCWQHT